MNILRLRVELNIQSNELNFPTHFWITINKSPATKILDIINKILTVIKKPGAQLDLYYQDYYLPKDETVLILADEAVIIAKECASKDHLSLESPPCITLDYSEDELLPPPPEISRKHKKKKKKRKSHRLEESLVTEKQSCAFDDVPVPCQAIPSTSKNVPSLNTMDGKRKAPDVEMEDLEQKKIHLEEQVVVLSSTDSNEVPKPISLVVPAPSRAIPSPSENVPSLNTTDGKRKAPDVEDSEQKEIHLKNQVIVLSPTDSNEDIKPKRKRKRTRSHKKNGANKPFLIGTNGFELPPHPSAVQLAAVPKQPHVHKFLNAEDPPSVSLEEAKAVNGSASLDCTAQSADHSDRDYATLPPLQTPPLVGDLIAYKILELSENFCPEISDYKEAQVLAYNSSTRQLNLELKKGAKKAFTHFEDDTEEENGKLETVVQAKWESLLEPKLIFRPSKPHT